MGKLMLNDISYSGGGGGGGSSVIPNPQGTPTDTLNTIEIDSIIYDIPGNGGGGGGSSQTITDVLWSGSETTSSWASPIQIENLNIDKYDILVVQANNGQHLVLANQILEGNSGGNTVIAVGGYPVPNDTTRNWAIHINRTGTTLRIFTSTGQSINVTKILGVKFCGTLAPMIYSLEEREVGVWIDNKPLYQKTYDLNNMTVPDNTWTNNLLNTTGTGINITHYEGIFGLGSTNYEFSDFSYYRNSSEFFTAMIAVDNDDINIRPNMNAGTPVTINRVTIQYTKNSDTPGSGSYGSLGVPMVHYDTEERVVGTYLGETLYQKTIPNISIIGTTTTIQTGVNIGKLVDIEATGYKIDGSNNKIRFKESYNDGGDRLDVEGINNDIRVICSSWFSGSTIDITIKYTKSST